MRAKSNKIILFTLLITIMFTIILHDNIKAREKEKQIGIQEQDDLKIKIDLNSETLLPYINIVKYTLLNNEFYISDLSKVNTNTKLDLVKSIFENENILENYKSIFNEEYYESEEVNNQSTNIHNLYKILNAYNIRNDSKNIIELELYIGFGVITEDGIEYYKDPEHKNLVGIYDENIIHDESKKFNKYKFSFEFIDGYYRFTSIEKIDNI